MHTAIAAAFSAFLFLFLGHVVLARLIRLKSEDRFIMGYYAAFPLLLFCAGWAFDFFGWIKPADALAAYLLLFVICAGWLASYPTIYGVCPTLIISLVVTLNAHGTRFEELRELLGLHQNSMERIADAVHDKLISQSGERLELTLLGRTVLAFFLMFRRGLGLKLNTL